MQFEPEPFRDALSCSLELLGAEPLKESRDDEGRRVWTFPPLDQRAETDASWSATLDTLRPPRRHEQKVTEWRREAPIRPIIFEDAGILSEDTVHLHLEQRVVQRLLARFRAQGFIHHDLSRACLAQANDSIPRVILLGRLSLYGQGAERLHEELVPVAARWTEPSQRQGPLKAYARETELRTLDLLEAALTGEGMRVPNETVQARLLETALQDIEELLPQLEPRANELVRIAVERLAERGTREERDLREILQRQRTRVGSAEEDGAHSPLPEQILDLKVCDPAMGSGAFLVEACRQLGDALVEAWHAHDAVPAIPPDEDEVIYARRLIAQRCLYGVDRNPVAVDLAKVSLWLVTLAKDHALTFVDHALRHGDSLVGLSRKQIESFHWDPDAPRFQAGFETMQVREYVTQVAELRQLIREADEGVSDWELRDLWDEAQSKLGNVRLFGDLVLAAFFRGGKPKEREVKRGEYASAVVSGKSGRYRGWLDEWRNAEQPLAPFHWEIEFPEVFERENSGFDVIVGNPPFAGKNSVIAANVGEYSNWLKQLHEKSHGNADLVAHFYRRAFDLIRREGAFGLIATNTIAQGDTRGTGLRWICQHGGQIYCARKRVKWPGMAAVVVSVLHIAKGSVAQPKLLDERVVKRITAFLFHRGGHEDPLRLSTNVGRSFVGSYILGMGFTFDDTDKKGVATPLAEMQRLIEQDPRNREVIFPYIGGKEVNDSPTHAYRRYVIDFGDKTEHECWLDAPDLMALLEQKVKPERAKLTRNAIGRKRAEYWWIHGSPSKQLYELIANMGRVLVRSLTSKHFCFAFLPNGYVYDQTLIVFPLSTYSAFCALQSRPHELWARFFGSSLEDRFRYAVADCFETFPFPDSWESHPDLEAAGKTYYEFRAALMVRNDEGLTKTYNRFHDPDRRDPEIAKLRELHADMDRAVLDAYGWSDIPTGCEFLLDYEIEEGEWGNKKKPYRYRWPEEVHDEVLARLLELNAERAKEEARSGVATARKRTKKVTRPRSKNCPENEDLFA